MLKHPWNRSSHTPRGSKRCIELEEEHLSETNIFYIGLKGRYPQQIPWKCKKLFKESKIGDASHFFPERKNVNLHFGRCCVPPSVCVASQQNIRWCSLTVILKPRALSTPITPWVGSGGSVRALYYSHGQPHTRRALWTIGTFSGALIWPLFPLVHTPQLLESGSTWLL